MKLSIFSIFISRYLTSCYLMVQMKWTFHPNATCTTHFSYLFLNFFICYCRLTFDFLSLWRVIIVWFGLFGTSTAFSQDIFKNLKFISFDGIKESHVGINVQLSIVHERKKNSKVNSKYHFMHSVLSLMRPNRNNSQNLCISNIFLFKY